MMIEDEVSFIPRELWNWGIKNRSGKLRSYSENIVKLHLLPTAKARVTYKGIEFKKMRFSSETALKENWFGEAREKVGKFRFATTQETCHTSTCQVKTVETMRWQHCLTIIRNTVAKLLKKWSITLIPNC